MGNANGIPNKIVTLGGKRHCHRDHTKPHKIKPRSKRTSSKAAKNIEVKQSVLNDKQTNRKESQSKSRKESLKKRKISQNVEHGGTSAKAPSPIEIKNKSKLLENNKIPSVAVAKENKSIQKHETSDASTSTKRLQNKKKASNNLQYQSSSTDFASSLSNLSFKRLLRPNANNKIAIEKAEKDWTKEELRIQDEYKKAEEQIRNSMRDEQCAKAQAQTWRARLERLAVEHRDTLFKQANSLRNKLQNAEKLLTYHETRAKRLHYKNTQMKGLIDMVKKEANFLRVESEKKQKSTHKEFEEKFATMEGQLTRLRQKVNDVKVPGDVLGTTLSSHRTTSNHVNLPYIPSLNKTTHTSPHIKPRLEHQQQYHTKSTGDTSSPWRGGAYSRYYRLPPSQICKGISATKPRYNIHSTNYTPSFHPSSVEKVRTRNRHPAYNSFRNANTVYATKCVSSPMAVYPHRFTYPPIQVAEHLPSPQEADFLSSCNSGDYVVLSKSDKKYNPPVFSSPNGHVMQQYRSPFTDGEAFNSALYAKQQLPPPSMMFNKQSQNYVYEQAAHRTNPARSTESSKCAGSPEMISCRKCSNHTTSYKPPPNKPCSTPTNSSKPASSKAEQSAVLRLNESVRSKNAIQKQSLHSKRRFGRRHNDTSRQCYGSSPENCDFTSDDDLLKDVHTNSYDIVNSSMSTTQARVRCRGDESVASTNSIKLVNEFEDVTSLYNDVIKKNLEVATSAESEKSTKKCKIKQKDRLHNTPASLGFSDDSTKVKRTRRKRHDHIESEPASPHKGHSHKLDLPISPANHRDRHRVQTN